MRPRILRPRSHGRHPDVFEARRKSFSNGEIIQIADGERGLTANEVVAGWYNDVGFRDLFIAELSAAPYPAFFWELPPLQPQSAGDPFECAVIRSEALARMQADSRDFAD